MGETRICRDHGGYPLPLDKEHFRDYKNGSFSPQCRKCINLQRRGLAEGRQIQRRTEPPVDPAVTLFLYGRR